MGKNCESINECMGIVPGPNATVCSGNGNCVNGRCYCNGLGENIDYITGLIAFNLSPICDVQ